MSRSDLCDINVKVLHTSERGALVQTGDCEAVWVPLSQVELVPNEDGKTHTLTLPEWLAAKKGLI